MKEAHQWKKLLYILSIPCVRTYENDLGWLTVGDVDLEQALTTAAADGGEATNEHIAHGLDVWWQRRSSQSIPMNTSPSPPDRVVTLTKLI